MRISILLGVLVLFAVALGGCGSSTAPLAEVQGKVSYKGSLLQSGTVVFTPDASRGGRGELAHGEIQSDGSFTLRTGTAAGAVPGWHRVTVAAVQPPTNPPPGHRYAVPVSLIPEKYRDPELSGLVREVKPNQVNTVKLELE